MEIRNINNGDSGSVIRLILNTLIDKVVGFSAVISNLVTRVGTMEANQDLNTFTPEDKLKLDSAITSQELTTALATKVTAVPGSRLVTEQEVVRLNESATLNDLNNYVEKVEGGRLITNSEGLKLANAVDSVMLNQAISSLLSSETKDMSIAKDYRDIVIYARNEGEGEEEDRQTKIPVLEFIENIKQGQLYPSYKSLNGVQNGENTQFSARGSLIKESAELYINGLLYPVNVGFVFENDIILLTGAPTPKSGDIVRLKAIYLTE